MRNLEVEEEGHSIAPPAPAPEGSIAQTESADATVSPPLAASSGANGGGGAQGG